MTKLALLCKREISPNQTLILMLIVFTLYVYAFLVIPSFFKV